jgi:hypothetical protein
MLKRLTRRAAATVAASVLAAAGVAVAAGPAHAATYSPAFAYQFASNTGQPGLAGSGDTYWKVSSSPLTYTEASQTLAGNGVDLQATPDAGTTYADSGVIVPLGTVASSGLLAAGGSLNVPAVEGSSGLAVNIYFDTSGNGAYFAFNPDGVYTGPGGDTYVTTGGNAVPAATVTADENPTLGAATAIWAWVGIDSTTAGKTVTGNVFSVDGKKLVTASVPVFRGGQGDIVNQFGNGLDAYRQGAAVNTRIVAWQVTSTDPAVDWDAIPVGGGWAFEYAPRGVDTGLCASVAIGSEPAGSAPTGLVERNCLWNAFQRFTVREGGNGSFELVNVATGDVLQPNGTGGQFTAVATVTNPAGSWFGWNRPGAVPASQN